MTLPDERYRAVKWAREFLTDLANPNAIKRVPSEVRHRARSALRHFPNDWDMKRAADAAPEIFQERMEPLTRMLTVYKIEQEEDKNDKTI